MIQRRTGRSFSSRSRSPFDSRRRAFRRLESIIKKGHHTTTSPVGCKIINPGALKCPLASTGERHTRFLEHAVETSFLIRGQQFVGDPAVFAKHANVCQEGGSQQDWLAKRRVRPVYSSWLLASTYSLVSVGGCMGSWWFLACEYRYIVSASSSMCLCVAQIANAASINVRDDQIKPGLSLSPNSFHLRALWLKYQTDPDV